MIENNRITESRTISPILTISSIRKRMGCIKIFILCALILFLLKMKYQKLYFILIIFYFVLDGGS